MKYDVFISYSRKDMAIADRICSALKRNHISYFMDRQDIAGGMEFINKIVEAIDESRVMLYLASENSYASVITQKEVGYAVGEGYRILPYIVDGSDLPKGLRLSFAGINWRESGQHPVETVLMSDLKTMLGCDRDGAESEISAEEIKRKARALYKGSSQLTEAAAGEALNEAMELVLPLAEAGDAEAMYMVGDIYQYYNWDGCDLDKSEEWWLRASEAGYVEAMYDLADFYNDSTYDDGPAKAVRLWGLAASKGHVESMLEYARALMRGYNIDKNEKSAIGWYEAAAGRGNVKAMERLYEYYMDLVPSKQSVRKAIEWYMKADQVHKETDDAMFFDYDMCYWTADRMYEGIYMPQDKPQALRFYRACAENGNKDAMLKLARMLHKGDGVPADLNEAKIWYGKIADSCDEARSALAELDSDIESGFADMSGRFSGAQAQSDIKFDDNPGLTLDDMMNL